MIPDRPDEAANQRVVERRWWPAAVVTGLILLVAGGARGVADAVAGPAGPPVAVEGVRIQPEPGWDLEATSDQPPRARFHRGAVQLVVLAVPAAGSDPSTIAERYVTEVLRPDLASVTIGDASSGALVAGTPAVRFGYVGITRGGVPIEGVITVATGSSAAGVFDAFAPQGELGWVADDLRTMIDGAVVV
jgi:hypothetical protein